MNGTPPPVRNSTVWKPTDWNPNIRNPTTWNLIDWNPTVRNYQEP